MRPLSPAHLETGRRLLAADALLTAFCIVAAVVAWIAGAPKWAGVFGLVAAFLFCTAIIEERVLEDSERRNG